MSLGNLGSGELIIIGIVIFIFFGGWIMTNTARRAGKSVKEVKQAKKEFEKSMADDAE